MRPLAPPTARATTAAAALAAAALPAVPDVAQAATVSMDGDLRRQAPCGGPPPP